MDINEVLIWTDSACYNTWNQAFASHFFLNLQAVYRFLFPTSLFLKHNKYIAFSKIKFWCFGEKNDIVFLLLPCIGVLLKSLWGKAVKANGIDLTDLLSPANPIRDHLCDLFLSSVTLHEKVAMSSLLLPPHKYWRTIHLGSA